MTIADRKCRITFLPITDPVGSILEAVAIKYNVNVSDLRGPERKAYICRARDEAYDRLYRETKLSTPGVARVLCRQDHTTVLHGILRHRKRQEAAA